MLRRRRAVSRRIVFASLVVIAIIAGSSFYVIFSFGRNDNSSPLSGGATSVTSTSTGTSTSSSTNTGILIMDFTPNSPKISPFLLLKYTLYFVALGPVSDPLAISLSTPAAINFSLNPPVINVTERATYTNVTVTMRPAAGVAEGLYPVTVRAVGPGKTYTQTLEVDVVRYLITSQCFDLTPPLSFTIPVGGSVTWLRLNAGERYGCFPGVDLGLIDVVIPSLNVTSVNLLQYQSFTYTFTKPGAYQYHCDFHASMYGVITVTA